MRRWLTEQLYLLYSFTLILFISNMFIHSDTLSYIVGTLAMVMIILSFSGASTLYRVLGIVFVTVGAVLFIYSDLPITHVPYHLTSTMPLLAFFTVLPWMNSAVRAGRFDRKINELMKVNIGNLGSLYVRSSFTTYILCMFINLSALLVSQEVLQKSITNIQKRLQHSFINKATLRSFVFALTWSPTEIMVAISIDATGISYLLILPWLLLISIIGLAVDLWRGHRQFKGILYESSEGKSGHLPKGPMVLQIMKLLSALVIFLLLVIFVSYFFELNFILSVTLVMIPFSFSWAFVMKRRRSFFVIGWNTWKQRTNTMQNFVVLFISLAFFSTSLNATPFLQVIQQPFIASAAVPIVTLLLIQFTFLLLSMVGVHPLATMGVLIEALAPLYSVMNPLSIAIVLITSTLSTSMSGMYNVPVIVTAVHTEQNPFRIMLHNVLYSIFYGGIGTTIGYLLL